MRSPTFRTVASSPWPERRVGESEACGDLARSTAVVSRKSSAPISKRKRADCVLVDDDDDRRQADLPCERRVAVSLPRPTSTSRVASISRRSGWIGMRSSGSVVFRGACEDAVRRDGEGRKQVAYVVRADR